MKDVDVQKILNSNRFTVKMHGHNYFIKPTRHVAGKIDAIAFINGNGHLVVHTANKVSNYKLKLDAFVKKIGKCSKATCFLKLMKKIPPEFGAHFRTKRGNIYYDPMVNRHVSPDGAPIHLALTKQSSFVVPIAQFVSSTGKNDKYNTTVFRDKRSKNPYKHRNEKHFKPLLQQKFRGGVGPQVSSPPSSPTNSDADMEFPPSPSFPPPPSPTSSDADMEGFDERKEEDDEERVRFEAVERSRQDAIKARMERMAEQRKVRERQEAVERATTRATEEAAEREVESARRKVIADSQKAAAEARRQRDEEEGRRRKEAYARQQKAAEAEARRRELLKGAAEREVESARQKVIDDSQKAAAEARRQRDAQRRRAEEGRRRAEARQQETSEARQREASQAAEARRRAEARQREAAHAAEARRREAEAAEARQREAEAAKAHQREAEAAKARRRPEEAAEAWRGVHQRARHFLNNHTEIRGADVHEIIQSVNSFFHAKIEGGTTIADAVVDSEELMQSLVTTIHNKYGARSEIVGLERRGDGSIYDMVEENCESRHDGLALKVKMALKNNHSDKCNTAQCKKDFEKISQHWRLYRENKTLYNSIFCGR